MMVIHYPICEEGLMNIALKDAEMAYFLIDSQVVAHT